MTDILENLTFGTAAVPALRAGRNVEPNPFDDKFPTKRDAKGEPTEAITITLPGTNEKNKAAVTNLSGKARRAADRLTDKDGNPAPQTARIQVTEEKHGKQTMTVLTIWTVDKIVRKSGDTADESAAPVAS